ncbi:MAG: MBL fold metallo-hydrolase [Candidatus Saliniplasma sp.]
MKVRWLGNSCIEIFGDHHILIDPNFLVEPEKNPDLVLVTHEHDDHFNPEDFEGYESDAQVIAPEPTLKKFDLDGIGADPGMYFKDVKILDSQCWKAKKSVSYYYKGVLHSGDSNVFPDVENVKLLFTACFPDYYDDYISAAKRLEAEKVVPFHYDPQEGTDESKKLVELMKDEGLEATLLDPGESVDI